MKLFKEWSQIGIFYRVVYELKDSVSRRVAYVAVHVEKTNLAKALESAVRHFDLMGCEIIQSTNKRGADHFELIACVDQQVVGLVVQSGEMRLNSCPSLTLVPLNINQSLRRELRDYLDKRSIYLLPRLKILDDHSPSSHSSSQSDHEIYLMNYCSDGLPGGSQLWTGGEYLSDRNVSGRILFMADSAYQPEAIFQQLEDLALQMNIIRLLENKLNPGLGAIPRYLSGSLGVGRMPKERSFDDRHIWAMSRNGRGYIFPKDDLFSSLQSVCLMTGQHPVKVFIFILFVRIAIQFNLSSKYFGTLKLDSKTSQDEEAQSALSVIERRSSVGRKEYSIHLGTPVHGRKPVVLIPDPDGKKGLVIKVGWNSGTVELVRREFEVLSWLTSKRQKNWMTAEPLWTEEAEHKFILASRMIRDYRRSSPFDHDEINLLAPLGDLAKWSAVNMPLGQSPFWKMIVDAATEVTDSYWRSLVLGSIKYLENHYQRSTITFVISHGDYTPWNIGWSEGRVCVLDWEYSRRSEPIGLDWINWYVEKFAYLRRVEPERLIESTLNHLKNCPHYVQYIRDHAHADPMRIEDRMIVYLVCGLIRRGKRNYGDIRDAFKTARMLSFMLHKRSLGGGY